MVKRSSNPRVRAPMGVLKAPRLIVALLPEERAEFYRRCAESGQTNSSFARHLVLIGLRQVADEAKGTSHA